MHAKCAGLASPAACYFQAIVISNMSASYVTLMLHENSNLSFPATFTATTLYLCESSLLFYLQFWLYHVVSCFEWLVLTELLQWRVSWLLGCPQKTAIWNLDHHSIAIPWHNSTKVYVILTLCNCMFTSNILTSQNCVYYQTVIVVVIQLKVSRWENNHMVGMVRSTTSHTCLWLTYQNYKALLQGRLTSCMGALHHLTGMT